MLSDTRLKKLESLNHLYMFFNNYVTSILSFHADLKIKHQLCTVKGYTTVNGVHI